MALGRWSFLLPVALFTTVCAVLLVAVLYLAEVPPGRGHVGMLLYFGLLTAALHYWQESTLQSDPKKSVNRFMAGMMIKMMTTLMVLLVTVILLPKERVLPIALPFIALYLAFLAFSTVRLTTQLRKQKAE